MFSKMWCKFTKMSWSERWEVSYPIIVKTILVAFAISMIYELQWYSIVVFLFVLLLLAFNY